MYNEELFASPKTDLDKQTSTQPRNRWNSVGYACHMLNFHDTNESADIIGRSRVEEFRQPDNFNFGPESTP